MKKACIINIRYQKKIKQFHWRSAYTTDDFDSLLKSTFNIQEQIFGLQDKNGCIHDIGYFVKNQNEIQQMPYDLIITTKIDNDKNKNKGKLELLNEYDLNKICQEPLKYDQLQKERIPLISNFQIFKSLCMMGDKIVSIFVFISSQQAQKILNPIMTQLKNQIQNLELFQIIQDDRSNHVQVDYTPCLLVFKGQQKVIEIPLDQRFTNNLLEFLQSIEKQNSNSLNQLDVSVITESESNFRKYYEPPQLAPIQRQNYQQKLTFDDERDVFYYFLTNMVQESQIIEEEYYEIKNQFFENRQSFIGKQAQHFLEKINNSLKNQDYKQFKQVVHRVLCLRSQQLYSNHIFQDSHQSNSSQTQIHIYGQSPTQKYLEVINIIADKGLLTDPTATRLRMMISTENNEVFHLINEFLSEKYSQHQLCEKLEQLVLRNNYFTQRPTAPSEDKVSLLHLCDTSLKKIFNQQDIKNFKRIIHNENNVVYAIYEILKVYDDQKEFIENLNILKNMQFKDKQRDSEILEKQLPNLSPILMNRKNAQDINRKSLSKIDQSQKEFAMTLQEVDSIDQCKKNNKYVNIANFRRQLPTKKSFVMAKMNDQDIDQQQNNNHYISPIVHTLNNEHTENDEIKEILQKFFQQDHKQSHTLQQIEIFNKILDQYCVKEKDKIEIKNLFDQVILNFCGFIFKNYIGNCVGNNYIQEV